MITVEVKGAATLQLRWQPTLLQAHIGTISTLPEVKPDAEG